jgi:hypothetical protein
LTALKAGSFSFGGGDRRGRTLRVPLAILGGGEAVEGVGGEADVLIAEEVGVDVEAV